MILARVDGHATAGISHPSLRGRRIVLCTPISETGAGTGPPLAAIDQLGAGKHSRVFITTDGSWSRDTVHDEHSPIRNEIIAIIDTP
ncbi:MAG: EutN/CcmL family microcompartment protein [Opitutales bacterium]